MWDNILRIGEILFFSGVLLLLIFDIGAVFGLSTTISSRIQQYINKWPIISIPLYAVVGFITGLAIHFEIASINPYFILSFMTIVGIGIGLAIYTLRKPGQGL